MKRTQTNEKEEEVMVMGICPLCNGFEEIKLLCPVCQGLLEDRGRYMDFFDDYSPYMPIDQMKLEDGFPTDLKNGECPHFLACSNCSHKEIRMIKE